MQTVQTACIRDVELWPTFQGSHFLENQGMSGNSVLTGMSGNSQGMFLFDRELTFSYAFANETLMLCICN